VPGWPPIEEPELLQRLAMNDEEFGAFIRAVVSELEPRRCDAAAVAQALGYPWARPAGSYLLSAGRVEPLEALEPGAREEMIAGFSGDGRLPVLSTGSNVAPEALERKLAHFGDAEERTVLALTGRLHDFDIGVAAQPTMYGSLPATPFPSPGTAVRAAILWVTPAQLTQLAWSEISYRLGSLRTRFEVDEAAAGFDEVLVFVSRFGTFCPDGEPVALAAIPADGRAAAELSQEQLLDRAAKLALGPEADAEALIRAIFEGPGEVVPKIAATVHRAALPFRTERWTPFGQFPPPPAGSP
jgi:hypothetical protein